MPVVHRDQGTAFTSQSARNAALFIAEAYFYDKATKFQLNFKALENHRKALAARRIVLTHMSSDMLKRVQAQGSEYAEDGKVFEL